MMVEKVGEIMSSCQDQNLLQLVCMFLADTIRAHRKFQSRENISQPEVVHTLQGVVGRLARVERTWFGLQQVATELGVLLDIVEGMGGETEQEL